MSADLEIAVGVVLERRAAISPWADFVWRPSAVLPGEPDAAPGTQLDGDATRARFYAGGATLALHRAETAQYRDNLATGAPLLWVVLRPSEATPPFAVHLVTADPSEGEAHTEAGTELVDTVAMPAAIAQALAAFVAEHHVEQAFFKRTRTRSDPQALARRAGGATDGPATGAKPRGAKSGGPKP
jgi:hypothetical protein